MTLLDYTLFAVMLLSGLLGAGRGLLRVMIAVICCAAAGTVAEIITGLALPAFDAVHNITGSRIAIVNILLFGALILFLVVAARISHRLLSSQIGIVDRILGFLFGLPRGLLVSVVPFLFYAWLVPSRSRPDWISNAKSSAVLLATGDWLMSTLPEGNEQGFDLILTWAEALLVNGVLLSMVVDFLAIVTGWMGRNRQQDIKIYASV